MLARNRFPVKLHRSTFTYVDAAYIVNKKVAVLCDAL